MSPVAIRLSITSYHMILVPVATKSGIGLPRQIEESCTEGVAGGPLIVSTTSRGKLSQLLTDVSVCVT